MNHFQKFSNQELKQVGIYLIISRCNQKVYVGSTFDKGGFLKRWMAHLNKLKKHKHFNTHLQRHVNLYGVDDLEFDILEVITEKRFQFSLEQYWINMLDAVNQGFNMCYPFSSTAGINCYVYIKTDTSKIIELFTKQKMSAGRIAEELDLNMATVYNRLKSNNITRKNKAFYTKIYREFLFSNLKLSKFAESKNVKPETLRRKFKKIEEQLRETQQQNNQSFLFPEMDVNDHVIVTTNNDNNIVVEVKTHNHDALKLLKEWCENYSNKST